MKNIKVLPIILILLSFPSLCDAKKSQEKRPQKMTWWELFEENKTLNEKIKSLEIELEANKKTIESILREKEGVLEGLFS